MMNPTPKLKLCWNCEGRVSFKDENCPFCAVYLHPESNEDDEDESSLAPPYHVISGQDSIIPKAPYRSEDAVETEKTPFSLPADDLKQILTPLILLLFGSAFLLFGLVLLLFSHDGVLTLRWNGNIWFAYVILALPLLFFGWQALRYLKDDEE